MRPSLAPMLTSQQSQRLWYLALGVGLCFFALTFRLIELQVIRHDELTEKAQANTYRTDIFEPKRGDILDVRGNILATSKPAKKI